MSDEQRRNPVPTFPRTPDEYREFVIREGRAQGDKVLEKARLQNEKIRQAAAIALVFKSEGWKYFWESMDQYRDNLKEVIPELKGSVFDKGAAVEKIQGKIELMQAIDLQVEHWLALSKQEPVDIEALQKTMTELPTEL